MKLNGKKTVYVNSNIYAENTQKDNFNKDSVASQIPDSIRYYAGNYWTLEKNNLTAPKIEPIYSISNTDENIILLTADKTKFYEDTFENGLLKKQFNKKAWQQFVEEKTPPTTQIFEDYYLKFPEPINITSQTTTVESDVSFINKEFIFNFYSPKFENLVGDQFFNVNTLPTLFNLLNDKQIDTRTEEENLIVSLGGFLGAQYTDPLYVATKNSDLVTQYFEEYADVYKLPEVAPVIKRISQINSISTIKNEKLDLTGKLNNKYVPFPFYSSIKFSNLVPDKADFTHILDSLGGLREELITFIQDQFTTKQSSFIYASENEKPYQTSLNEYDLKTWISSNLPISGSATDEENLNPSNLIRYTTLINYIKEKLKITARKYQDFTTKPCNIEPLFYKIEKRQFNFNTQNKPISTVFVLPNKKELINYFDTQIKYATEYYYTITAFTLAIGTQYSYEPYYTDEMSLEKSRNMADGLYKLKVKTSAIYKIFEIPFAKFSGAVHEKPFTKPVVKVDQSADSLLFRLDDSDLLSLEKFQVIENNDFKIFESIRLSQDNEDAETIESVINTNSTTKLQIYRISTYPTSYINFQNKLYKTLILNDNSKSFLDTIQTNTKYYYLFRTLNQHDIPSNVSQIQEIQLKDEDGYMFLETKIIDLDQPYPKNLSKGMKRYLLIRPSIIQTQPKYGAEVNTIDDIGLGPSGENVWDKDFILRITSKKTNRVLKFNVKSTIVKKNQ